MIRRSMSFALTLVVLLGMVAAPRAQALDLAAVGVLTMPRHSTDALTPTQSLSGKVTPGFGGLLSVGMIPLLMDIQVGVLYAPKKFTITDSAATGVETSLSYKALEIPVLARFTFLPIVSFGAGAYYAKAIGSVDTEFKTPASTTNLTVNYDQLKTNTSDLGLVVSVDAKIGLMPGFSLLVDVRQLWGLTNLDTGATTTRNRSLEILAGLNFGF